MAAAAMASTAGAHDCQCRYFGQSYAQGETVCMRGKIAQCGMYLNNSSWKSLGDVCPQAGAPDPQSRQLAISPSPIVR
jgi:hypothetical protein